MKIEYFEWDVWNIGKNQLKHRVELYESEEIFFNVQLLILEDRVHSKKEQRYYALGITDEGRKLFVVFTIREKAIRVISSRDMSRKERSIYDEEIKKNT